MRQRVRSEKRADSYVDRGCAQMRAASFPLLFTPFAVPFICVNPYHPWFFFRHSNYGANTGSCDSRAMQPERVFSSPRWKKAIDPLQLQNRSKTRTSEYCVRMENPLASFRMLMVRTLLIRSAFLGALLAAIVVQSQEGTWSLEPAAAQRQAAAEELRRLADGLHARSMDDLAIAEYQRLIREYPDYPQMDAVLFRLAESYRRIGQGGLADRLFQRILREFFQSAYAGPAALRRGEWLEVAGQADEAESHYATAMKTSASTELIAVAGYRLGRLRRARGDRKDAERVWRIARDAAPDSPAGRMASLEWAMMLLDGEDAIARRDEAIRMLESVARSTDPATAPEALFWLLRLRYDAGDFKGAVETFAELSRRYPEAPRIAEARRIAAWAYLRADRAGETVALARQTLARPSDGAEDEWLYLLASAQRRSNAEAEAARTYHRLLDQHPKSRFAAAAATESARLAFLGGKFEEAKRLVEIARQYDETAEEAQWILGETQEALGRTDEAMRLFRQISERQPAGPRAPDALYRLARLFHRREEWAEAATLYRRLANIFPKHSAAAPARAAAAACLARLEKWEEAVQEWGALLAEHGETAFAEDALFYKASAEMRMGRDVDARAGFETLLRHHPDTTHAVEARYALSLLLERALDLEAAEAQLTAIPPSRLTGEWVGRFALRRAALLRKLNRLDDAARVLNGLLTTPIRKELTPEILEWLVHRSLEGGDIGSATRAAETLRDMADETWQAIGWYWFGRTREIAGKPDEAIAAYARAVASVPAPPREQAEALYRWAELLAEGGDLSGARARFTELSERATGHETLLDLRARALFGLGRVAEREGRWEEAARYFLGVGILFDDPVLTPESLRRAAEAYRRLGAEERAEQILRERTERYPRASATE